MTNLCLDDGISDWALLSGCDCRNSPAQQLRNRPVWLSSLRKIEAWWGSCCSYAHTISTRSLFFSNPFKSELSQDLVMQICLFVTYNLLFLANSEFASSRQIASKVEAWLLKNLVCFCICVYLILTFTEVCHIQAILTCNSLTLRWKILCFNSVNSSLEDLWSSKRWKTKI